MLCVFVFKNLFLLYTTLHRTFGDVLFLLAKTFFWLFLNGENCYTHEHIKEKDIKIKYNITRKIDNDNVMIMHVFHQKLT